ncbi:MAG TPA: thioesterase domain-containing protein, partial [Pseudomonadales bacterium]|nr:thioesterase domain-containing protein [Pseudomonadales bacterium]
RLFIGGVGLAKGYFGEPEKTADKFIFPSAAVSALIGDQRLYDTGDSAMLTNNGDYLYFGRQDDQVKIRGFRIELLEVERAIAQLALVKSAAVVVDTDPAGQCRLVAFVSTKPGSEFKIAKMRMELKPLLPDYMIPTLWIEQAEMPLNNNGKIDRGALKRLLPELLTHHQPSDVLQPRNETEHLIFDIWADCLGHRTFGIEDDFFAIGGHSLLVAQMLARVNKQFQTALPLTAWMHQLTVASLAGAIDANDTSDSPLQVIKTSSAATHAVVLLPPMAGLAMAYRDWLPLLKDSNLFIFNQHAEAHTRGSIEQLADYYVDLLQPHLSANATFSFIGWSMGGAVAIEMAERLAAAGVAINRLLLLDTAIGALETLHLDESLIETYAALEVGDLVHSDPERMQIFRNNMRAFAGYRKEQLASTVAAVSEFYLASENPLADLTRSWLEKCFSGKLEEVQTNHYDIVFHNKIRNRIAAFAEQAQKVGE